MANGVSRIISAEEASGLRRRLVGDVAEFDSAMIRAGLLGAVLDTIVQQAEQIAAVLALHVPMNDFHGGDPWCDSCDAEAYPCATARALGVTDA